MQEEQISIIVPVYNVENYLENSLQSIVNQTYKNLEIILIDDGSTDNSLIICNKFAKQDNRIKVLHKQNEGVCVARNKGIELSTSKYVTFIDSDDYIAADYVQSLYDCIIANDVDLVISNAINIAEDGTIVKYDDIEDLFMTKEECLYELLTEKHFYHVCWGNLYKKEFLKQCRFNPKYRIAEDLDFLYEYISKIENAYFLSKKTYYWIIRNSSVTHLEYSEKWNDELEVCNSIIDKTKILQNKLYKGAIGKYIRANVNQAHRFNLDRYKVKLLRNNIRMYKGEVLKYDELDKKSRLKTILFLYSYTLFKFASGIKSKIN